MEWQGMSFLRCAYEFPSCVSTGYLLLHEHDLGGLWPWAPFWRPGWALRTCPGALGWPAWPPGIVDQPLKPGWLWSYLWCETVAYAMLCYAKLLQSCPTLCDPIDGSSPGSPVPGILQARILEWVAISFSNAWKRKVKVKSLSRLWLLATPWTAAYQAPLSMDFPGKSTGVGCHCLLRDSSLPAGKSVMRGKNYFWDSTE